jgi:hypothetical protein
LSQLPEPAALSAQPPRYVFVADIECLLCARAIGVVIADHWPPDAAVQFQPAGSSATTTIDSRRLRCTSCGGNTVACEIVRRRMRKEGPIDWRSEQPRRGRPPKWLVDERRAELAALHEAKPA